MRRSRPATLRFELGTSLGFGLLLVMGSDGRELAAVGAWSATRVEVTADRTPY